MIFSIGTMLLVLGFFGAIASGVKAAENSGSVGYILRSAILTVSGVYLICVG